jgi:hypothetical protein
MEMIRMPTPNDNSMTMTTAFASQAPWTDLTYVCFTGCQPNVVIAQLVVSVAYEVIGTKELAGACTQTTAQDGPATASAVRAIFSECPKLWRGPLALRERIADCLYNLASPTHDQAVDCAAELMVGELFNANVPHQYQHSSNQLEESIDFSM